MSNIKMKKIIISIVAGLIVLVVSYLLLSLKDQPLEQILPWTEEKNEESVLSPAEYEELKKNLAPSPTATPTLTDAEYQELLKNLAPSPTATPTLTDEEYEKLLENLRPRNR